MHIWGPVRSGMTKVTLLNGTDRCLSDWLNLFDWATGRLRLHKSFKGRRFCKCEKKRGRGEKGKEKHPRDISTATGVHLHTLERLPGALFISFTFLIHRCTVRALSGHRPPTMAVSLENLSTVAVIDQEQNSADDRSPLKPALGTRWALTITQLIPFSLRMQSRHFKGPYIHSFVLSSAAHYGNLAFYSAPFLCRGLPTQRRARLSLCLIWILFEAPYAPPASSERLVLTLGPAWPVSP